MKLILNRHRNALAEIIKTSNLDPKIFHATEEKKVSRESLRIELMGTPHFFVVEAKLDGESRVFWSEYSTFKIAYPEPIINKDTSLMWTHFPQVEVALRNWLPVITRYLNHLKEEEEDQMLPDLWSELGLPSNSSSSLLSLQNTPFSNEEQVQINASLREYLEEIKKRELLTTEQFNLLHQQVEDLVKSSKRLGRKDWLQATVGALIGVTLSAGLASPVAVEVIHLAGKALQWLAHTPLLLPQYKGF